jgi:hypothetical protein
MEWPIRSSSGSASRSLASHLEAGRRHDEMIYEPRRELLGYLRANGFKTFIVSGGGSTRTKYELRDGVPVLVRVPEIDFIDDKAGKPVGINKFIGRRPPRSRARRGGAPRLARHQHEERLAQRVSRPGPVASRNGSGTGAAGCGRHSNLCDSV